MRTRDDWLSFERRIEEHAARLAATPAVGDNLPFLFPNLGPEILATAFGADLEFGPDTSWSVPTCHTVREVLNLDPDFDAPLWRAIERYTRLGVEASQGRWLTGYTDLHPNADLLASLLEPQDLCLEFADDPEGCRLACEHVTNGAMEGYDRLLAITADQPGQITWLPCPYPGRMYVASCDFSAMLSPAMFRELVLPSIVRECRGADRVIYHLDGPDALRHLDVLLQMPEIHAIQWVYGAGNGPAARWLDVYRRIQSAGKGVWVQCESAAEMERMVDELRTPGLWLDGAFTLPEEEAKSLVRTLC